MTLSVIIPWRDSGCDWRMKSVRWLVERYDLLFPDIELILGGVDMTGPFNRSAARNEAIAEARGDVLLIADADTVFQPDQIETGLDALEQGAPWVIPYSLGRYYNLSADETIRTWREAPDAVIAEPDDHRLYEHKIDSWAGMLLVSRENYDKVGGYDERFKGWGYEDNAFRAALDHHVGPHQRVDGYTLHLWHPAPEAECFSQPHIQANRDLCLQYEQGLLP